MIERVRQDYLVFGRPEITEEDIAEVVDALRSGWIGTGPRTSRFEANFAGYVGAPTPSRSAPALRVCSSPFAWPTWDPETKYSFRP